MAEENDAAVAAIKKYELLFILNTEKISGLDGSENPLAWNSVRFGKQEIDKVPDDREGVYAFVISDPRAFLPPHGYIMYIGLSGKNAFRSLHDRYSDYFKPSELQRRPRIKRMILQWHPLLRFHFAPVARDLPRAELKALEKRLITAFLPPCCKGDIEADTREKMAAF
ncbi:MAG: hypothetical protein F4149_14710 [Gammaproteobacteria bacterium]|nr:hypothetical protein [Gammaproteobacteria bacterium]MYK83252.1 hypothetical protein [Gammaproteobacteria bacterium]